MKGTKRRHVCGYTCLWKIKKKYGVCMRNNRIGKHLVCVGRSHCMCARAMANTQDKKEKKKRLEIQSSSVPVDQNYR